MTDPLYPVGARVIYQGRKARVYGQAIVCNADSVNRFIGYHLTFDDGSFSGWHPEADISPLDTNTSIVYTS